MSNMLTSIVYLIFLNTIYSTNIEKLINKYDAILEDINVNEESGELRARKEINTNKQILIVPTRNIMSSEEKYQFEEYFSRSTKEKLVGRLLIERFIGNESYFYEYIENLPKPYELIDYYHYTEENLNEFAKRNLVNYNFIDRKAEFNALITKIPSNEIPTLLLNFELYNWATSIVESYGISMKKKYYSEVKRLYRYVESNEKNPEIALIPGIDLFKPSEFKFNTGNNLGTSIFAYKEHIYLNSDRFIDEGDSVHNELHFLPNVKLFQIIGKSVKSLQHEEMQLKLTGKDWTLKKYSLCKELECLPGKKDKNPNFILKYEFNERFFKYCQIDQLGQDDDVSNAYRQILSNKRITDLHNSRSLLKCYNILNEFLSENANKGKTSVEEDISHLLANSKTISTVNKEISLFAISQKKIISYHKKIFLNRLIKEMNRDIWVTQKGNYV